MKIFSLWLDAVNRRAINKQNAPFLYSLSQKHDLGVHRPVFGFGSIGAAFYTGQNPTKTDQFCLFWKKQDSLSQFWPFCPDLFVNGLFNLKRVLSQKTALVRIPHKKILAHFSPSFDHHYHFPRHSGPPTLLNILTGKKISYLDYNWPYLVRNGRLSYDISTSQNDLAQTQRFIRLAQKDDYQVLFLHLYDLDKAGHESGPNSKQYLKTLSKVDLLVKQIFNSLVSPDDKFLIWSDHGVEKITAILNLEKILPPQEEYLYFLDSTLARFWFKDQKIKNTVISLLANPAKGHWLSEKEKTKLEINFSHSKYGQEIFLVRPGVLILPNYFQKEPVKGMHGYEDSPNLNQTFFITNLKAKEKTLKTQQLFSLLNKGINIFP